MNDNQLLRYSRHILLPKIGYEWQFIIENHANKKITAKKINIGLVWAGSTIHTDDIDRKSVV